MSTIINITGMSCNHCKMAVEKALKAVPGVKEVEVNLERARLLLKAQQSRSSWSRPLRRRDEVVS